MTRILIAFGDSHTAGSEIDEKYSVSCHSRAYPSHIAKYYGMEYRNFAQTGGSNDWALIQFHEQIKFSIKNKEEVFVLFNFLEPSRTFFENSESTYDPIMHCFPGMLHKDHIDNLSKNFKEKSEKEYSEYLDFLYNHYAKDYAKIIPLYRKYIQDHTIKSLDQKSITQILHVQKICNMFNVPFIFHTSCLWYSGDWSNISKNNFYGHDKDFYRPEESKLKGKSYSFWGYAGSHPEWKDLGKEYRWSDHYPEEYHIHYASYLINFINKQKILEGYI